MSKKRKNCRARNHLPNSRLADWCLHVDLYRGSTVKEVSDFSTSILFGASEGGMAKFKAVTMLQNLAARENYLNHCGEKMRIFAHLTKVREGSAPAYKLRYRKTFYTGMMTEIVPRSFS
jgi:hypothetical protein